MRQYLLLLGAFATIAQVTYAAPICSTGSLASYIALGPGSCTIGTDTFSNFQTLSGLTGATAIDPGSVLVTPSGDSSNPTLTFDVNATANPIAESIFTYQISGNIFTGSMIMLSNSTSSGDGAVTDIQNLCGAGTFGPDGVSNCTGTTLGPLVAFAPGADQASFNGVAFLTVTDDFTLDAGLSGSASGGTFADQFTAVTASNAPEPGSVFITGLGIAFLYFKRRSATQIFRAIKEIM